MTVVPRDRRRLPAAALACLLLCIAQGVTQAGVAGKDPIPVVETARSGREFGILLERDLASAGGRLFIVSPQDYLSVLLPLRRSGFLKEVVSVLPDDNVFTDVHLENVRSFLLRAGVSKEDCGSFLLDNGAIRGTAEGMPLRLLPLSRIPKQAGDFLVVVDTSMFPALYRNDLKTPMLEIAWKAMLTLADRGVGAKAAIVVDSVGRDDFPLSFGYLAAALREMLSGPGKFTGTLPEKWRLLLAAEHADYFGRRAEALDLYKGYLSKAGADASVSYKLALVGIRDLDIEFALHWLGRAVETDSLYRRAYPEIAAYVHKKDLFDAAERILQAGLEHFPKDPMLAGSLAGFYVSRSEALQRADDVGLAAEYLKEAMKVEGAPPAVTERAKALMENPLPPDPR